MSFDVDPTYLWYVENIVNEIRIPIFSIYFVKWASFFDISNKNQCKLSDIAQYFEQKSKEIDGDYRCIIIICDCSSAYFFDRITQILKLTTFHYYQFNSICFNKTPSAIKITLKFTQELTRMKISYQQTMLQELIKVAMRPYISSS